MSSGTGIEVDGLDTFRATTAAAAGQLRGLEDAHQRAGEHLLAAARPKTPRRTGALEAGLRYDADSNLTTLADAEDYWPYVEYGTQHMDAQPWLADTVRAQTGAVAGIFLDELDDIVHTIHGT